VSTKYSCIVADPAWSFGDKLGKRGADANYKTMTVDEIRGLARWRGSEDLHDKTPPFLAMCGKRFAIADDALLFLWRVASMPQEALDVIRYWGFEPKSEIVWIKAASEHDAKVTGGKRDGDRVKTHTLHFGMGRYVRGAHETCIIAARGQATALVRNHSTRSVFIAPVPRDVKGKIIHSAKPPEFYEIVEALSCGPRLELFAREGRPGWTSAGNAVGVVKTPAPRCVECGKKQFRTPSGLTCKNGHGDAPSLQQYEVWSEGFRATGEHGRAQQHGKVRALSFKDACHGVFSGDGDFDEDKMTYWGCKLFDNERDARRAFG
jgi:N6-adenosine-specific RNA methylase IME4